MSSGANELNITKVHTRKFRSYTKIPGAIHSLCSIKATDKSLGMFAILRSLVTGAIRGSQCIL